MSELQVKIQTTAFIRHPPLLFVSSKYAQVPLLFGTFFTAFIWHSGVISEVPKGWHYDFQDGETVFNFQGPRGVVLQYTGICVLIRELPKLTSCGGPDILEVNV